MRSTNIILIVVGLLFIGASFTLGQQMERMEKRLDRLEQHQRTCSKLQTIAIMTSEGNWKKEEVCAG